MTDIILSIHPKWAEKIYSGEKTIEIRKTRPCHWCSFPSKVIYLHETSPVKKMTGFVFLTWAEEVDKELLENPEKYFWGKIKKACLTEKELIKYSNKKNLYFWNLKDPYKFDVPQDIKGSIPQSWRYLKEGELYD
jgi:predicted transcriptional regulator